MPECSIFVVATGVSVGAGLQGTVAIINLCCYYLIGIPIGALLGYVAHLEVEVMRSSVVSSLLFLYVACNHTRFLGLLIISVGTST